MFQVLIHKSQLNPLFHIVLEYLDSDYVLHLKMSDVMLKPDVRVINLE